ncbi:MAG: DUF924 family protein [Gammaproteobacteria bacterium]
MDTTIEAILTFWFSELDEHGYAAEERNKLWFQGGAATDATIRTQFGAVHEQALRGELDHWAEQPRGRLALILVLDQFSRNIFRGSGAAFAGDAKALKLCLEGLRLQHDQQLAPSEQVFFYLPLEHSENLADQKRCVALYTQLRDAAPPAYRKRAQGNLDYAVKHQEIIEQFGRFPHRNKALGRISTDQEKRYLETATTFGQ